MQPKYTINELKKRLQLGQHKMTPQRKVVLEVFLDNENAHLSAEDVRGMLRDRDSDIGLATVYRALELMCDLGILQKMDFGDGCSRYELNLTEPNAHQHHHLICRGCGKVFEFSDDLMDELEDTIAEKCKFKILDHQVKFFGYCEECQ
ncbi:MAG: transcriptional repressor [Selenomonadales bacterium]|nr:transcriptional repressor [Selenomonadales bacterium]MDY3739478.1 transcriptional repressor [Selenomonadaceae bacterium]MEE1361204.1 transcriptional repressor [Selenomonadaceae bacterium]